LEAIINGPLAGTFRRPRTFGRKASIRKGVKNARRAPYGKLFSTGTIYCLLAVMTPSEGE
jgi:hypothetical protein